MISPNGRALVVRVHMGWDKSEVYLRDLSKGMTSPFVEVAVKTPALFDPIPKNDRLYIQTNDGAPRYKLYAIDYAKPERASWKEVLPESKDVLSQVDVLKNEIVVTYMHDASSRVERFTLDGKSKGAIALPRSGLRASPGCTTARRSSSPSRRTSFRIRCTGSIFARARARAVGSRRREVQ